MGGTLESWDGVTPGLAAQFRVLRYDQRGRAARAEGDGIRGVMGITLDNACPADRGEHAAYDAYRGRYLGNDPVGFALAHRMLAMTNMLYMLPKISVPTMVVAGKHDT